MVESSSPARSRYVISLPSMVSTASTCPQCDATMEQSELRLPVARMIGRVGSPSPPRRLVPTWTCRRCGVHQLRIEP